MLVQDQSTLEFHLIHAERTVVLPMWEVFTEHWLEQLNELKLHATVWWSPMSVVGQCALGREMDDSTLTHGSVGWTGEVFEIQGEAYDERMPSYLSLVLETVILHLLVPKDSLWGIWRKPLFNNRGYIRYNVWDVGGITLLKAHSLILNELVDSSLKTLNLLFCEFKSLVQILHSIVFLGRSEGTKLGVATGWGVVVIVPGLTGGWWAESWPKCFAWLAAWWILARTIT